MVGGVLDFASTIGRSVESIAIQSFNELQCAEKTEMESRRFITGCKCSFVRLCALKG